MMRTIAILEDDGRRAQAMTEALAGLSPRVTPVFFDSAAPMIAWLGTHLREVRLLCLDHDLGPNRMQEGQPFDPGTGRDVADFLAAQKPACQVLIHSTNVDGARGMHFALQDAGWTVQRLTPFDDLAWITAEWVNRVAEMLKQPPEQGT